MRLREIYHAIKPNIDNLSLDATNRGDNTFNVTGIVRVIQAIKNIEQTGLFSDAIGEVKNTRLYEGFTDLLVVSQAQLNAINSSLQSLRFSTYSLIQSLEKANIDLQGEELGLSIQIPENLSFSDFAKLFEKFKRAFELPVKEFPEGGEIKIKNFDSGSYWIDIILPSVGALLLVGRIVYSGVAIYNKIQQAKASESYAEGLSTQAEWISELKKLGEKQIELLIETEARSIEKETYNEDDAERTKRLGLAIKETSELISKGVQIHPSLLVPEEASKIFPDFKLMHLIQPKTEKLSEGKKPE